MEIIVFIILNLNKHANTAGRKAAVFFINGGDLKMSKKDKMEPNSGDMRTEMGSGGGSDNTGQGKKGKKKNKKS